jgi:hypothetical protein
MGHWVWLLLLYSVASWAQSAGNAASVLGQTSFSGNVPGSGDRGLTGPSCARVDAAGAVYVCDEGLWVQTDAGANGADVISREQQGGPV